MGKRRGIGQSIVEFALLLPILLMMLLGCLDLGRAFMVWMAVTNASGEAARYASEFPKADVPDIIEVAKADIAAEGLYTDTPWLQVDVSYPESGGLGPLKDLPVRVTVRYTLTMITSYMFAGRPMGITARTEMAVVANRD